METQDTDQDLTVLATKYQCKKCQIYGHFTSKCLTKAQNTNVNTVEEVNAVLAFSKSPHHVQAELSDNDSSDVQCIICTVEYIYLPRFTIGHTVIKTQVPQG